MTEKVLAAVRVGPERIELREYPMPDIPDDSAMLKVEVAGICGTDVKMFRDPVITDPVIMGHENVGIIERAGTAFTERQGLKDGDRVFVEHYVGCRRCAWCYLGEFRHCELTDWRTNPDARRYGYTSATNQYHLWGGFAQYMYLPWNAVLQRVPEGVSAELGGLATPLSNGIEWALKDAKVGYGSTVFIQGPGQQGLAQVVAAKQAGASLIIVSGTGRDSRRLELARELGADLTIDVQQEDPGEAVLRATGGRGVDIVLDCTSGAGYQPILIGIDVLKRRMGTIVVQGEGATMPDFPMKKLAEKAITLKGARGHSYNSCELAVELLASGRFPLETLATHTFGLEQVEEAIRTVAGERDADVVHASLMPWS